MKIKYILPCIIWLTKSSLGKIILPSGVPVPEPLLSYFSCPIGNTICLNGNGRSCHYKYLEYCENDGVQAEKLAEDFDMGNFTPVEFCEVINDSCHYIDTYTPELYDSDVYDLDQYLTCGKSDTICQYGKRSGCKKHLGNVGVHFLLKIVENYQILVIAYVKYTMMKWQYLHQMVLDYQNHFLYTLIAYTVIFLVKEMKLTNAMNIMIFVVQIEMMT